MIMCQLPKIGCSYIPGPSFEERNVAPFSDKNNHMTERAGAHQSEEHLLRWHLFFSLHTMIMNGNMHNTRAEDCPRRSEHFALMKAVKTLFQ